MNLLTNFPKLSTMGLWALLLLLLGSCATSDDSPPMDSPLPSDEELPLHWQDGLDSADTNWGIAAAFSADQGLEAHPAVLAREDFESGAVELPTQEDRLRTFLQVSSSESFTGRYAGEFSWEQGDEGPTTRFELPDSAHRGSNPSYFVRMCMKFDESFHPGDLSRAVGVKGFGIYFDNGTGNANTCEGMSWYNVSCQFVGWGPSAKPQANDSFLWVGHLYSYNRFPQLARAEVGDVRISDPADGTEACRFSSYADPMHYLPFGEWRCYELGLYLNTPGVADGEARFWVDGQLLSRTRSMRFREGESDFPDHIQINLHRTTPNFPHTMRRWIDNIVISNRYIGPVGR